MPRPGPLLRLVHSLERRRAGRAFTLDLSLKRADTETPVASARMGWNGPRAYVVGAGDRVDLAVPGGEALLLPRHVAIVVVPALEGAYVRAVSLHPERGLFVAPLPVPGLMAPSPLRADDGGVGGAVARDGLRLLFDGLALDVRATLDAPELPDFAGPELIEIFPLGAQLSFFSGASVRSVGDAVSSVSGPDGGGHAIPALMQSQEDQPITGGTLVLRTRAGVHRVDVNSDEMRRGLLVGRSRRCVLGRGFDENDGLSRVHALVIGLEEGVLAFDLASRYGLRDVSRPNRITSVARLDDGIGCLVYGAGLLTFEPS